VRDLDNGSFLYDYLCSLVNHHMNSGVIVITKPMFPGTNLIALGVHDMMIVLGCSVSLFYPAISSILDFC
jgi:hypothetical protein